MGARNKARTQMKLGLGTAGWGKPYGISNSLGVPTFKEIKKILSFAINNGIDMLHTKWEYNIPRLTRESFDRYGFNIREMYNSIYQESEIDWDHLPKEIQLPINIFDQRLIKSGCLKRLSKAGVKIHARSIFLQGIISVDTGIQFIRQIPEVEIVFVGVVSVKQLKEIIQAWEKPLRKLDFSHFAIDDLNIIDPRRWKVKATTG